MSRSVSYKLSALNTPIFASILKVRTMLYHCYTLSYHLSTQTDQTHPPKQHKSIDPLLAVMVSILCGSDNHITKIMETTKIRLSFELTEDQATDLAEFLKRVQFSDFRKRLNSDDEAYTAMNSLAKMRKALATAGFNPR
jgi:hypothetical protein